MSEIAYNGNGLPQMAYKSGGKVVLTSAKPTSQTGKPLVTHVGNTPSKLEEEGKKDWVPWGINDDFPRKVAEMVRLNTVARPALQLLTKMLYGQELFLYKFLGYDDQNRIKREYVTEPRWEVIINRTNFDFIRLGLLQDYVWYANAYVELIFNATKTEVYSINFHKASKVRLSPYNAKTGRIDFAYINANFPDCKKEDCEIVPMIDPINYAEQIEEIKADKKNYKYIFPIVWPDVLNDYYSLVYWDGSRSNGWMQISNFIPKAKQEQFNRELSLMFHIEVPMEYWEEMYPDFQSFTVERKDDLVNALLDEMNEKLTGMEGQQTLLTFYRSSTLNGKETGQWKINKIDRSAEGKHLPDSSAANAEILFSMLVNPAITGVGMPGGNYTGGANSGGSNIRESLLVMRSMLKADRDINNGWFNFVKMYMGFDPALRIGVQDEVLTTLDQGKGTEKIVS